MEVIIKVKPQKEARNNHYQIFWNNQIALLKENWLKVARRRAFKIWKTNKLLTHKVNWILMILILQLTEPSWWILYQAVILFKMWMQRSQPQEDNWLLDKRPLTVVFKKNNLKILKKILQKHLMEDSIELQELSNLVHLLEDRDRVLKRVKTKKLKAKWSYQTKPLKSRAPSTRLRITSTKTLGNQDLGRVKDLKDPALISQNRTTVKPKPVWKWTSTTRKSMMKWRTVTWATQASLVQWTPSKRPNNKCKWTDNCNSSQCCQKRHCSKVLLKTIGKSLVNQASKIWSKVLLLEIEYLGFKTLNNNK